MSGPGDPTPPPGLRDQGFPASAGAPVDTSPLTAADPDTSADLPEGRRPALPLIFTVTITGILANTLVGPAIPDILDDFGLPDSRAGVFVAAGTLPGIVVAPLIGLLADRFGRRAVLTPCLVAFGAFGCASAFAPSFEVLLVFRLLQGVGSAGLINLAVVLIGDHWDGIERARRVGQNAAVLTTSLAVFPPLGGLLTEIGGWRLSFAPYGIGLATALLIWRRLSPARPAVTTTVGAQLRATGAVARTPVVVGTVAIGSVIFMLIFGLFLTVLPLHLERSFGLGPGARGLVIATPALTSTISALRLGWLRARVGAVGLLLGASVLFVVGFTAIGLAGSLPVLLAGALLYGSGEGIFIPTLQDVVTGAAPPQQRGAIVALWVGAARAGQTVGPLAMGSVYGAVGGGRTFLAGAGVAVGVFAAEAIGRFGRDRSQ
jgi:MFS transporter, ACDE family, multidrug resistance protein